MFPYLLIHAGRGFLLTGGDDMSMRLEPTGPQALWEETFQKLGRSAPMQRADEGDMDYLGE